jgi:hypothetical protein
MFACGTLHNTWHFAITTNDHSFLNETYREATNF